MKTMYKSESKFGSPGSYSQAQSYYSISTLSNMDFTTDVIMIKNMQKCLGKERNQAAEYRKSTLGSQGPRKATTLLKKLQQIRFDIRSSSQITWKHQKQLPDGGNNQLIFGAEARVSWKQKNKNTYKGVYVLISLLVVSL